MREVSAKILFILIVFSTFISLEGQNRLIEKKYITEKVDSISDALKNVQNFNSTSIHSNYEYDHPNSWEAINPSMVLLQHHQNEVDELRTINARFSIYLLIVIMLAALGIVFLIIIRKKNYRIKKINNELIEKQEVLLQVNEKLEDINLKKNKFFKIISHDLKNPFNFLISSSSLLNLEYNNLSEDEKKELIKSIEKVSRESFELLSNLLKWVSLQSGSANFEVTKIRLDHAVFSAVKQVSEVSEKKSVKIINNVNSGIELCGDLEMLTTAIRNLLVNAIKYSYEGGEVLIDSSLEHSYLVLAITDNGIGMTTEISDLLFKFDKGVSQYGTQNEKGTGLGLLICKEIIEEHKGQIFFESKPEAGSKFFIKLPLPVKN